MCIFNFRVYNFYVYLYINIKLNNLLCKTLFLSLQLLKLDNIRYIQVLSLWKTLLSPTLIIIHTIIRLPHRLNFKWFPQQTANNPSLCSHHEDPNHHYWEKQFNPAISVSLKDQIRINLLCDPLTHYPEERHLKLWIPLFKMCKEWGSNEKFLIIPRLLSNPFFFFFFPGAFEHSKHF